MTDSSPSARSDAALIGALEAANYHPLWDRYKRITPMAPASRDQPMHWPWREFEPLSERAAREVPIEDVERRAIIMANPAFGGETVTTGNLIAAFTVLEPGDRAVPHRHTAAAIRFATRSEGAVTIVNGQRCDMHEGDLVLTPPMCWHGHINQGDRRTTWFDAANMPLVCGLDASFFEPGTRQDAAFWKVGPGDAHSQKYRYSGAEAVATLDALTPNTDGSRLMRYSHPAKGGPVMPTLDCYRLRLQADALTRARRTTANQVCLVVAGEGRSTVGDHTFEWSRHDVFTIPHWRWSSHQARSADADFFVVTDRSLFEALDLLRDEEAA